MERYTGAAEVRQAAAGEGAVTALVRTAPRVLCYATQRGGLHGWDLRARGEAYRVRFPSQLGVITSAVTEPTGASSQAAAAATGQIPPTSHDPRWLVAGTTAGCLVLVDLRFGVSVAEWRHPNGRTTSLSPFTPRARPSSPPMLLYTHAHLFVHHP